MENLPQSQPEHRENFTNAASAKVLLSFHGNRAEKYPA
jgi:hypothetical protein